MDSKNNKKHPNDKKRLIRNSTAEFLIFSKQKGKNTIEVRVEEETVWRAVLTEVR